MKKSMELEERRMGVLKSVNGIFAVTMASGRGRIVEYFGARTIDNTPSNRTSCRLTFNKKDIRKAARCKTLVANQVLDWDGGFDLFELV